MAGQRNLALDGSESAPSRYVVGIDLGTTNCAVAYVDTHKQPWSVATFRIPQLVAAGEIEPRETLPSFHYQAGEGEFASAALRLPWNQDPTDLPGCAVGILARDQGMLMPGRSIASAKSWLCHAGVDRSAPLLPWHAAPDVKKLSAIEASAQYLLHIRQAWDHLHPSQPLADQEIALTLPASFDEIARELTVAAAAQAGLKRVMLIEEPQAAFYAWIHKHSQDWQQHVQPGQTILVCDIGGGTSDFTLIRAQQPGKTDGASTSGDTARVQFHRIAVGDHLILGGDNLDLALAHFVESEKIGQKQSPRQWDVLVRTCRQVKESLLREESSESFRLHLPGSGSRLIGGGLQVDVSRQEVIELLLEGFFPRVALQDQPSRRQSGFQEFGLPYAADAAVTRYLAAFLTAHGPASAREPAEASADRSLGAARPDIMLFNGGVMASPILRQRLLDTVRGWFSDDPHWQLHVLDNDRLDLAVARGAAYFGMVRRGEGVRIAADLARAYYIGVESDPPAAVCLVPGSAQPGDAFHLTDRVWELLISQPAEFPLLTSSTRLTDAPGEVHEVDPLHMTPLPPIRTVLRVQRSKRAETARVHLHARLTEIGTMELWCSEADGDRTWRLQFDIRAATQTDMEATVGVGAHAGVWDEASWSPCYACVADTFGPHGKEDPQGLVKQLAIRLAMERQQWPPSLLRRLWETLMEFADGRRRSAMHETRWLNLLGFSLRPGYGCAVDDWRVSETWRTVHGRLFHHAPACRTESLVLWRRVAGGLTAGQQRALADPLVAAIRALQQRFATGKSKSAEPALAIQESTEVWRLLGSLELLTSETKSQLGNNIVALMSHPKLQTVRPAMVWALGRIGSRTLAYGPLNEMVSLETVATWLEALLMANPTDSTTDLAVMLMARKTGDRYRDLPEDLRARCLAWFAHHSVPAHYIQLVDQVGQLDSEEADRVFGEALPKGLRLLAD